MKKIWMLLTFIFILSGAFSQVQRKSLGINDTNNTVNDKRDGKQDIAKKTSARKVLKELNLTKEQKLKLKEMRQDNKSKRDEIVNDASQTEDQKHEKLKAIRKAAAYNLQRILSDEQKANLKEIRKGRRSNSNRAVLLTKRPLAQEA
ncbi:MAG: hypothetical protein ABI707_19470 [Ferruginibacter sp.]